MKGIIALFFFWLIVLTESLERLPNTKEKEMLSSDKVTQKLTSFMLTLTLAVGIALSIKILLELFGILLSSKIFIYGIGFGLGYLSNYKYIYSFIGYLLEVNPRALMEILLPVLIFKSSLCLDTHAFIKSCVQILLIVFIGSILNSFLGALLLMISFYRDEAWYSHLLSGFIINYLTMATYPEQIVVYLQNKGARHMSILFEGESMLTLTLSIVVSRCVVRWSSFSEKPSALVLYLVGGILVGFTIGKILTYCLDQINKDVPFCCTLTLSTVYLQAYICQEILGVSSELSILFAGMTMSYQRERLPPEVDFQLTIFWRILAYVIEIAVYFILGLKLPFFIGPGINLSQTLITYLMANFSRFLALFVLIPLLSRVGYGFSLGKLMVMFWGGNRSIVMVCRSVEICRLLKDSNFCNNTFLHMSMLVILSNSINVFTMPMLLKILGWDDVSMLAKTNMNNCMNHINSVKKTAIYLLKMNSFLADANWPEIREATALKHPYTIDMSQDDDEDDFLGVRYTVCPDCLREVPDQPSALEMQEMLREARARVLRAEKIFFLKQFENGMISKEALRILLHCVETALDSKDKTLNVEVIYKLFKKKQLFTSVSAKAINVQHQQVKLNSWESKLLKVSSSPIYLNIITVLNFLDGIEAISDIAVLGYQGCFVNSGMQFKIHTISCCCFLFIFLFSFFINVQVFFHWKSFKKDLNHYIIKSWWNLYSFVEVAALLIQTGILFGSLGLDISNNTNLYLFVGSLILDVIRLGQLLSLLRTSSYVWQKLEQESNNSYNKSLAFAYTIGKAYVTAEEEIMDFLHILIDNQKVRENIKQKLLLDKKEMTRLLGLVQKDKPWIAITVKTKQAVKTILNGILDDINTLKICGWTDEDENDKLMRSLEDRLKFVKNLKIVQPISPQLLFKEVPWMYREEVLETNTADFLFNNIVTKSYDPGDMVCEVDKPTEGIFILFVGIMKITYIPSEKALANLAHYGALPIADFIPCTIYNQRFEDYILTGNSFGELAVLTGRNYSCYIQAETHCRAYLINTETIQKAFENSPDHINGLKARMWKFVGVKVLFPLIVNLYKLKSAYWKKVQPNLQRAVVPKLAFPVLRLSEMIERVVLLEGTVRDLNSKFKYVAPSVIPRTVLKLGLITESILDVEHPVETKLLIIPVRQADVSHILQYSDTSEIIFRTAKTCLRHSLILHKKTVTLDISEEEDSGPEILADNKASFASIKVTETDKKTARVIKLEEMRRFGQLKEIDTVFKHDKRMSRRSASNFSRILIEEIVDNMK